MTAPDLLRQRFLAAPHTLRNERRDFHEWHRGRPHYLLWALDDVAHLPCRITRLSLMGYVAADIGGELFTLADYHLAERRLQWREARIP